MEISDRTQQSLEAEAGGFRLFLVGLIAALPRSWSAQCWRRCADPLPINP